jgi:hypothetical protein
MITGKRALFTTLINHECLYWIGWNVTIQHCRVKKKYSCDYGTDNYNPICPGINGETSYANEGLFAYPAE